MAEENARLPAGKRRSASQIEQQAVREVQAEAATRAEAEATGGLSLEELSTTPFERAAALALARIQLPGVRIDELRQHLFLIKSGRVEKVSPLGAELARLDADGLGEDIRRIICEEFQNEAVMMGLSPEETPGREPPAGGGVGQEVKGSTMEIYTLESVEAIDQFIRQLAKRLVSRDSYADCASFVAGFIREHCSEGPGEGNFFKGEKFEDTLDHETGLAWSAFFPIEHSDYIRHLMGKDAQEQLFNLLVELPGFVFFQEKMYRHQELRDSLLKHCRGYLEERGIQWTDDSEQPLKPSMSPSADFCTVTWGDEQFNFTKRQAACVCVMWEAFEQGNPFLSQHYILENARDTYRDATGLDHKELEWLEKRGLLRDVFKVTVKGKSTYHKAWDSMIKTPTKGSELFGLIPPAQDSHEIPT